MNEREFLKELNFYLKTDTIIYEEIIESLHSYFNIFPRQLFQKDVYEYLYKTAPMVQEFATKVSSYAFFCHRFYLDSKSHIQSSLTEPNEIESVLGYIRDSIIFQFEVNKAEVFDHFKNDFDIFANSLN